MTLQNSTTRRTAILLTSIAGLGVSIAGCASPGSSAYVTPVGFSSETAPRTPTVPTTSANATPKRSATTSNTAATNTRPAPASPTATSKSQTAAAPKPSTPKTAAANPSARIQSGSLQQKSATASPASPRTSGPKAPLAANSPATLHNLPAGNADTAAAPTHRSVMQPSPNENNNQLSRSANAVRRTAWAGEAAATPTTTPENVAQVTFATEGADFDPCVTPDGSQIVFASTQHRTTSDIYIKGVEGRVVTQLTSDPAEDLMPSVSPDGQWIAFASDRSGNWDIYVMPISGGRSVQVTSDPSDELHPSWSPDGKQIAFCRLGAASGRWEMWTTDAQSQASSRFLGYGLFPRWCPTASTGNGGSDKILFQLIRERGQRAFGIWTLDYKDGQVANLTELVSSSAAAFINPTWSPDGKHVVFAAVPNPAEWANLNQAKPPVSELWMMNADGSGKINLMPGNSVALMPAWGPNNQLFFVADRSGVDNIWSLNLSTAVQTAGLSSKPASGHGTETAGAEEHKNADEN